MKAKWKTLIGAVLFAAFLSAAYFAYSAVSKQYKPDTGSTDDSGMSQTASFNGDSTTGQNGAASSTAATTANKNPAPDFTVYDKDSKQVKLSDFAGKPVVLNFWTTWCPSCASELPHFNEAYEENKNDVVFLMIDITDGQRETQKTGLQYVSQHKYSFPFYSDGDLSASNAYSIYYIPDTFFIDASGNIVKSYEGAIDKDTLIDGIEMIKK